MKGDDPVKKSILTKAISILLCVPMLFSALVLPVFANSAQKYFLGVDATGAVIKGSASPIIVEHERLTFDIGEFPKSYYETQEEYLEYNAKVTAEYTFYNPSEYTVTAKLLFPFGNTPWYIQGGYNENGEYVYPDDIQKYDITVNGQVVDKKIRYTSTSLSNRFDLETELALIADDFVSDPFYAPDLPVTKYIYRISEVESTRPPIPCVACDVKKAEDYRIYLPELDMVQRKNDGDMRLYIDMLAPAYEFEMYVFGTPFASADLPEWKCYQGGKEDRCEVEGKIELVTTESTSFLSFVLAECESARVVSEIDLYNAAVEELNNGTNQSGYPFIETGYVISNADFLQNLMRWYEYDITLAPGERIVNTVTAPMYPDIDMSYEPDIFEYTYLLSPAKTWKNFGTLEIVINTPYYVTKSNQGKFTKTDHGYTMSLEGLPAGELEFTLSTGEKPKVEITPYTILGFMIVGGVILFFLSIAITITVIIVKLKKWSKRKKQL